MANFISAIYIDSDNQRVTEVDIDNSNLPSEVLSALNCDIIDKLLLNLDHYLIFDKEGLLLSEPKGFRLGTKIFAGNGLILRTTTEGAWVSVSLTPTELDIKFLDEQALSLSL